VRYMQVLELEPIPGGGAKKVDASSFATAPLPPDCPFCGMDLDDNSDIYILHRNFKIFFG
jgi:hypothetical protein